MAPPRAVRPKDEAPWRHEVSRLRPPRAAVARCHKRSADSNFHSQEKVKERGRCEIRWNALSTTISRPLPAKPPVSVAPTGMTATADEPSSALHTPQPGQALFASGNVWRKRNHSLRSRSPGFEFCRSTMWGNPSLCSLFCVKLLRTRGISRICSAPLPWLSV